MPRIALGVEYDGTDFAGWQSQANARSVQSVLELAVGNVANETLIVNAAGRTDSGVHATGQVVHFDTQARRGSDQWLFGINSNLPPDVSVRWAREVAPDFDARRSAQWRRYVYLIHQGKVPSAILCRYAWWVRGRLDVAAMRTAAQAWIGEHDFSAFRAAGCQSTTPMRYLRAVKISSCDELVAVEVTANAFLYHMVRNLIGSLSEIGLQRRPVAWAGELLAGLRREDAGATAPACGLTLVAVEYPRACEIPPGQPPVWLGAHWT